MFALATPVQFGSGWVFYKEACAGLRHRKLGMAAMVVLGTTAAYASSCLELLSKLICKEKAAMSLELRMKTSRFHSNLLPFPHLFTSF